MSRSRKTAKDAGTRFETNIVTYLQQRVNPLIERRRTSGNKDRGDITGWHWSGMRIVAECKDYGGQIKAGPWLAEAETERANDDADIGLVIPKRRGALPHLRRCPARGITDAAKQYVLMELSTLVDLMNGGRDA